MWDQRLKTTKAKACLVTKENSYLLPKSCKSIIVDNPYLSFACLTNLFKDEEKSNGIISDNTFIQDNVNISKNVQMWASVQQKIENETWKKANGPNGRRIIYVIRLVYTVIFLFHEMFHPN